MFQAWEKGVSGIKLLWFLRISIFAKTFLLTNLLNGYHDICFIVTIHLPVNLAKESIKHKHNTLFFIICKGKESKKHPWKWAHSASTDTILFAFLFLLKHLRYVTRNCIFYVKKEIILYLTKTTNVINT